MEAVDVLATIAALGVLCQKLVEWIRSLGGDTFQLGAWTRLVALVVGTGEAWLFDLDPTLAISQSPIGLESRPLPTWLSYLIAGGMIAAAAGYFADRSGRSNPQVVVETPEPSTTVTVSPGPVIDP